MGGRANASLRHRWRVTTTYDVGDNLAGNDNKTEGGGSTKNLAADGQPSSNKDCVFVDVVVVSGEGCEGGAPMMGAVTPQCQDCQQQGGGWGTGGNRCE